MDSSPEIENIFRRLYERLAKFYPDEKRVEYDKYLEKSGLSTLINNQHGDMVFLIDVRKIDVIHISGNVFEHTGYQMEEFGENIASGFMNLYEKTHLSFTSTLLFWVMNILGPLPAKQKTKQNISVWGLKILNKNGNEMRWYMNIMPLEHDSLLNPTLILLVVQDITHLVKGNAYHIRGVFGDEEKRIFSYHSEDDRTVEQEIISEREKEVLKYIKQGLDTKAIATVLNISPNTVDNHRRNSLSRTGSRDTTALIHLCKMMGII